VLFFVGMHIGPLVVPIAPSRPSLLTVASMGAIALRGRRHVHEALGKVGKSKVKFGK
jgi:hypothetical protein